MPASTLHRVLCRHGLNHLSWIDRTTGQVIRRIQTDRPGELVHVDVKKLGWIPAGGGWRAHGRENVPHHGTTRVRYDIIHSAIDAHTRIVYSEVLPDERGVTCAGFMTRALGEFASLGIDVERVMTDNAKNYVRSGAFQDALGELTHTRIRPRRPQTNGKAERFNRTLLDEWAYVRTYTSNAERTRALDRFLHTYNYHRGHTSLGGKAPIEATNPTGQHN